MAAPIDFHTHAFPDAIARTAIAALEKSGNIKAYLDGTIDSLLASMDQAGIDKSVLCSIATRPEQFQPILDWSMAIRSSRIIPLPSIHPTDPKRRSRLEQIHALGFPGIKLHPFYQDFFLDDPSLTELYYQLSELGLLAVVHTGYDIAYPRIRRADPRRIAKVSQQFPELKLITTHLGSWDQWDEVQELLIGKPIYMELSFSLDFLDQVRIREMLLSHPREYLLFGTDSPWTDQATTLQRLKNLNLPDDYFSAITRANAARLLEG
ncbi:amidohydrolase family protein [Desulfogranum mediterraneum]|uniref:amidohydrolase family protein n=1 Tax=Desulfogranum mediterraneum TaxID=160661 RepID=UPI00040948B7|nr:amidohydrolase family protein [Desulfogranum mediterraneum]